MKTACIFACCAALLFTGCDLPGRPHGGPEVPRPDEVKSFETLYGQNCAGCHGTNGDHGVATNLANPVYQAIVDDATLRDVTANGRKGTLMPGFSVKSGGELTDDQVNVLVQGMRERWRKADALGGQTAPPYKAAHAGNAAAGQQVYAQACASCHGESAQKPGKDGSILDGSFLALIHEQTIRTTVIAGRPDIGQPDWRNHIQGRSLTDDEITNVSAWMLAQRPSNPGQPYSNTTPANEKPQEQPAQDKK